MRIFLHQDEKTFGPYSLPDIKRLLASESVSLSTLASYDGGGDRFMPLSAVPGVAGALSGRPSVASARFRLGGCGWTLAAVGLLFIVGLIRDLVTKDDKESTGVNQSSSEQRALSPREFGRGLGRELLRHAETDDGTKGMFYFAQSCRTENPTVKTYSDAEFNQFYTGLVEAYTEWRVQGYTVPNQ